MDQFVKQNISNYVNLNNYMKKEINKHNKHM